MLAYGRTELVAIDSYVKHGGLVLLPPRARYMGRLEWPCAACPIELAVIDGELVSIQEPLTLAGARAIIIDAALGAAHDHPDDVRCSVRSCACAPSHLHAPLTPRAPVWQVANEVYLQCVPEKQENLLRARTLMRGSSLARFLALCEGCDIEWKGDGSNTLQMFVEDREHMKKVRYAHRLLTHLVLSAHTCQHPYHSTHHIPRPPTALLTFAGSHRAHQQGVEDLGDEGGGRRRASAKAHQEHGLPHPLLPQRRRRRGHKCHRVPDGEQGPDRDLRAWVLRHQLQVDPRGCSATWS